jgi:hypothetical protein
MGWGDGVMICWGRGVIPMVSLGAVEKGEGVVADGVGSE